MDRIKQRHDLTCTRQAGSRQQTSQSVVASTVAVLRPPCFSSAISPRASPGPREATSLQHCNHWYAHLAITRVMAEAEGRVKTWAENHGRRPELLDQCSQHCRAALPLCRAPAVSWLCMLCSMRQQGVANSLGVQGSVHFDVNIVAMCDHADGKWKLHLPSALPPSLDDFGLCTEAGLGALAPVCSGAAPVLPLLS